MTVRSVALLHDGFFEIDMGMLVYLKSSYYGQRYLAALKPMLVRSDEGNVLIDTGMGELPEGLAKFYNLRREGKGIVQSLKLHGLEPDDIDIVVNTHLHVDHAGNNSIFKNAKFYAQKKEIEFALKPSRWMRGGYVTEEIAKMRFEVLDGDSKIIDGITTIFTGGHTPGHQAVIVETPGTTYIYCGDIAPLRENLEKRSIVGILTNPKEALEALERLASMRGTHVFSHDNEQMEL
jgi:glyoxylase-like metal-dependent hydrolase (beta-lactamase superfamily II)